MTNNAHTLVGLIIPLINVRTSLVILHRANWVVSSSLDDEVDVLTLVQPLSGNRESDTLSLGDYNHGFKNRTGPASPTGPTVSRSWFQSGPMNWTGIWLNRNQTR